MRITRPLPHIPTRGCCDGHNELCGCSVHNAAAEGPLPGDYLYGSILGGVPRSEGQALLIPARPFSLITDSFCEGMACPVPRQMSNLCSK
ncbi:hypothetical protein Ddc_08874 [Ditylenchus destructor]|nr:hypothetical protein Ddc_08874 [Ditylenchus destructor]